MRLRILLVCFFVLLPLAAVATPEIGLPIPDFEFRGVEGALHRKADFVGRRGVVIAWFPKAFTPG
ncbi:MAG TPA: hypothetical protein ENI85_15080 [Deltaproteobacteria bacterium]|nr:hypothetical protein [Deltaproteobacteria bacterium]